MTVQKSFSIFVIIVILSVVGVLFWSIDASTFVMLKNANPTLLLCAAALVVLGWLLDACKFMALARAAGEKLSFKCTLSVVWINYFGCAITPMQSGGGPFQIYLLYKNGVSVGKSVAITLVRTLQILFLLALVVPFSLIADREILHKYIYMRWYAGYVVLFILGCAFLLIVSVIRPQWIKHWVNAVLVWVKHIGAMKAKYLLRAARWINREIDAYNTNIKLFLSTGRWWFFLSIAIAALHQLVYMSVMPCLILAAGFSVNYLQCILAESLLIFLLYFVPTPGASGAAEGGAVAVFGLFVPWSVAGIMAVTWRLLTEYTGIAIGTFIVIRMLGWGGANRVMTEEEKTIERAEKADENK
ncbi:MAG: lysylphosphatidylglycerol synthase transmembrane domain-containing protein [Synergistaceae bacterium]|nr:lysylphosphatidylglycerol synthase transmembrane domain-containing protein [Synergistaceae bacterium]